MITEENHCLRDEFKENPLFGIIFDMVYTDLRIIFFQEVSLTDVIKTYQLPAFTKTAVLLVREAHLRGIPISQAALEYGMDMSDWTDWTILYAADCFVQENSPVIKL